MLQILALSQVNSEQTILYLNYHEKLTMFTFLTELLSNKLLKMHR